MKLRKPLLYSSELPPIDSGPLAVVGESGATFGCYKSEAAARRLADKIGGRVYRRTPPVPYQGWREGRTWVYSAPAARTAHVISHGLGGTGADLEGGGHLSSYDSAEDVARERGAPGAWVLDKRAVLERNPGLAIRSPLVSLALADSHVSQIDKRLAAMMLPGMEGGFASLTAAALAYDGKEPGPLDMVAPDLYVAWWRKAGARIGRVGEGGTVTWEPPPALELTAE